MKKFLIYAFTFIITVIASAFGTIGLNNIFLQASSKGNQENQTTVTPTKEKSDGEKLLDGLLSLNGLDINLNVNLLNNDTTIQTMSVSSENENKVKTNIKFNGSFSIQDLENIKLKGTLTITNANTNIVINISFLDNVLYLSNDSMNIKLEVASLTKVFDLLPQLGLNLDLGIDMGSIDSQELLSNLQNLKAEVLEDGSLKMPFKITDDLCLDIYADKDYVVTGIETDILNIKNNLLKIDAIINKNEELQIESPDVDDSFADVTKTINILDNVKDVINSKNLHVYVNASSVGKLQANLKGDIYLDFNNKLNLSTLLKFQYNNKTYDVTFSYLNDTIYLSLNNLKFKITKDNLEETINFIVKEFNLDKTEMFKTFNSITNFDLKSIKSNISNIDLNNLLEFSKGNENSICLKINSKILGLEEDLNVEMKFDDDEKFNGIVLSNINVLDSIINAEITYKANFDMIEIDTREYQSLENLKDFIKSTKSTIDKYLNEKQFGIKLTDFNIVLNNQSFIINGTILVNLKNAIKENNEFDISNLTGYANLTLLNNQKTYNVIIHLENGRVYLSYNNLNLSVDINKVKNVVEIVNQIKFLSESLNNINFTETTMRELIEKSKQNSNQFEFNFSDILSSSTIEKFKNTLKTNLNDFNLDDIKQFSLSNKQLSIILAKTLFNQDNDIELNLSYDKLISEISFNLIKVKDMSVCGTVNLLENYQVPSIDKNIYSSLDSIENLFNAISNTAIDVVDNKHITFDLNTEFINTKYEKNSKDVITKETETLISLQPSSFASFDFSDAYSFENNKNNFDFKKLKAQITFNVNVTTRIYPYENGVKNNTPTKTVNNTNNLEITYLDNVIYIKFNKMYAKISGDSIKGIISTVCEMLNIDVNENLIQNIKNLISQNGDSNNLLEKLNDLIISSINLTDSNLKLDLIMSELGNLKINLDYNSLGLSKLNIKDLKLKNNQINNLDITLKEFEPISYNLNNNYIDLSNIDELLIAVKNTTEFNDYEIDGSINLKLKVLSVNIDWNIPLNAKVKLLDEGFEASIKIGAIPVIPGVNDDTPYKAGNTVSGIYSALNRILNVYIKDNMVYFHRSEEVPVFLVDNRIYEKKLKIHIDTLLNDPLYYVLQYGFGFSDSIMSEINKSFKKERENPLDYSNILKDFSSSSNAYSLTLNLKELAENDKLDTMTLGVITKMFNEKSIIGAINFNMYMPLTDSVNITLSSSELLHKNIGQTINFDNVYEYINNNSHYKEGAEWDAYNDDWQLAGQRKFTLSFETNSEQQLENIVAIAGSKISVPTLNSYYQDENKTRKTYTFAGWYTTKTFDKNTEYTGNVMPRKDTTLYAKWEVTTLNYITIHFVTNGGSELEDLCVLENSAISLPQYFDLITIENDLGIFTKQFDGWCLDENCEVMFENNIAPNSDITLYAKWSVIDSKETHLVTIYDTQEKILTRRVLEGNSLTLAGSKFTSTTKYYLDSDYKTEIDIASFVMPSNDVVIYIKNKYNVTVKSDYGVVTNNTISIYQGSIVEIVSQQDYFEDDGTQTERTIYTFNGYYYGGEKINDISNFIMPNKDITIVANWTIVVKQYVTITFNVNWAKPDSWQDNNSNAFGKITCKQLAVAPQSFKILEGYSFNPSIYTAQCSYEYRAMGIKKTYKFVVHSWSVDGTKQLSYNKLATEPKTESYDVLTNLTVTEDTILYAVWKYAG